MTDAARDYSETLFLPKTDFPMRAGLPQKEPELLAHWERMGLYSRLREAAKGRTKFVLHAGDVVGGGEDRARRGGGGVRGLHERYGVGEVSGGCVQRTGAGYRRRR